MHSLTLASGRIGIGLYHKSLAESCLNKYPWYYRGIKLNTRSLKVCLRAFVVHANHLVSPLKVLGSDTEEKLKWSSQSEYPWRITKARKGEPLYNHSQADRELGEDMGLLIDLIKPPFSSYLKIN